MILMPEAITLANLQARPYQSLKPGGKGLCVTALAKHHKLTGR